MDEAVGSGGSKQEIGKLVGQATTEGAAHLHDVQLEGHLLCDIFAIHHRPKVPTESKGGKEEFLD